MVDTGYREYHISAPKETQDALREEFNLVAEDDDGGGVTLIGPAGEDPGPLADTFPVSPVQEFMDDNDLDYGAMSSSPVRRPSELPEALRDEMSVRDIIGDVAVSPLLENALDGADLREYSLQGRVRFDTGDDNLAPLTSETIQQALDAGLVEDDSGPYPSAEQILSWDEELQAEYPDLRMCGVGFFQLPTKYYPEGHVNFDGVFVDPPADEREVPVDAVEWLETRFGEEATEFFVEVPGVRIWWD